MKLNAPRDLREMGGKIRNGSTILSQIWPPSEESVEMDKLYERLKEEDSVERAEIIGVFKALDEKGYGHYIVGRRGKPTRLEWSEEARSLTEKGNSSRQEGPTAEVIDHKFNLRPDFELDLSLPKDLTSNEAERLSRFVKTLPFDDERG